MTAYDIRAQATAGRTLAPKSQGGKGQMVTLTEVVSGAYNPATGSASTTPAIQQGSGVVDGLARKDRPGTQIKAGDTRFLLSPFRIDGSLLAPPKVDSMFTFATGEKWRVVDVEAVAPAGADVLFTLHLRS